MLKVLQINLNHCVVAQDLMFQMVREEKADIAIVSEQYRDLGEPSWVRDTDSKAAIWVCGNNHVSDRMAVPLPGFTWIEVAGCRIYSCYLPPSDTNEEYLKVLDAIVNSARSSRLPVVIGGDFNAWAREWGSVKTNYRGRALLDAFAILELEIANNGTTPTYSKGDKSSIVDLTFVDPRLMGGGIEWSVSDRYTGSDHHALVYKLQLTSRSKRTTGSTRRRKWAPATFNQDMFLYSLEGATVEGTAEERVQCLSHVLVSACDTSMVVKCNPRGRPPVHWWNESIAETRRECLRARRLHQRAIGGPRYQELTMAYEEKRKKLKAAIKEAKRKCWKDFCERVDSDPWGQPYKTVMNKIKPRDFRAPSCPYFLDRIVHHLFPEQRERPAWTGLMASEEAEELPEVSEVELLMAIKRISVRKAPGPDGIPGLAIKTAARNVPDIFRATFSECLREGCFPTKWKLQKLVLLPKGNKPPGEPSSYRPLCLIDIVGKLFERIIDTRLGEAIKNNGGLSENQFGFRKGRSTIDAIGRVVTLAKNAISGSRCTKRICAIIALDIRNAFNSARWDLIMKRLEELQIPLYLRRVISSYLTARTLLYETDEGTRYYNITGGVPQGSVLGPTLWNILYDGLLRLTLPDGVYMVAYADDVALVVVAKDVEEVRYLGDVTIEVVASWLSDHGLSLAAEKTEAVIISRTKKRLYTTFTVEDRAIETSDTLKYLGITIDARLSFKEHLLNVGLKASRVARALAGIMPNIGGPKQPRRSLLSSVVGSVMLYGAPIWADATRRNATYGAICRRANRTVALRVACAYRTVSDIALSVIAGLPPLDLLAAEREIQYCEGGRDMEVDIPFYGRWSRRMYEEWQRRWDSAAEGRWTHRIIPKVVEWTNRTHGFVTFHLTQVLTGHGCWRSYLHRIGVYTTAECPACPGIDEDVSHVLFQCPRFSRERDVFRSSYRGPMTVEGMGRCLLASQEGWNSVIILSTTIVERLNSIRKEEERRRR